MHTLTIDTAAFEAEKNRKAFIYTVIVCAILLLLFFIIKWQAGAVAPPHMPEDLIEINLGNDNEGFGQTQPMIKGDMAPARQQISPQQQAAKNDDQQVQPDNTTDKDAAPLDQTEKKKKPVNINPAIKKSKPQNIQKQMLVVPPKPLYTMKAHTGPGGNNAAEDNGFTSLGNSQSKGIAGSPTGKLNGNGPFVMDGDRTILRNSYTFPGDLDKATINAIIQVSTDGTGTFVSTTVGSTSTNHAYVTQIIDYLHHIKFNKTDHESNVTVQFNFIVK